MKSRMNVKKMTQTAVLVSLMLVLAFTPLGYLKTAGIEITFVMIPVIIGAVLLGPATGTFLGCVFGLTSFIQCFGMSEFGTTLFSINPFSTFIVCVVPRTLMGLLTGLVFRALYKNTKSTVPFAVSSVSGALFNTVLFMSFLLVLFGNSEYISAMRGSMNLMSFVVAFVGINGLIEAVACFIIATAITKVLSHYIIPAKKEEA